MAAMDEMVESHLMFMSVFAQNEAEVLVNERQAARVYVTILMMLLMRRDQLTVSFAAVVSGKPRKCSVQMRTERLTRRSSTGHRRSTMTIWSCTIMIGWISKIDMIASCSSLE